LRYFLDSKYPAIGIPKAQAIAYKSYCGVLVNLDWIEKYNAAAIPKIDE
jgi:hypothetical protein